jgi:hypothetical protein
MQISIFVRKQDLEELSSFLKNSFPYEHSIEFVDQPNFGRSNFSSNYVEVTLFYDDYVMLNDWKIKKN